MNQYYEKIKHYIDEYYSDRKVEFVDPLDMVAYYGIKATCYDYSQDDKLKDFTALKGYYGIRVIKDADGNIKNREKIVSYRSTMAPSLKRKVLIHELAHCLLDKVEETLPDESQILDTYYEPPLQYVDDDEQQREDACNLFAREVLMPRKKFVDAYIVWKGVFSQGNAIIIKLADVFTVPEEDIRIRLEELGCVVYV